MERARPATVDDLDRLSALAALAVAELSGLRGGDIWAAREAAPGPPRDHLAAVLNDPSQHAVAGEFGDYIAAYGIVRVEMLRTGERLGVVEAIFTEGPFRGVGLGEVVMDRLVGWATAQGCAGIDSLALPGDRETKNFFERFGLKARALLVHAPLPLPAGPDQ